MSLSRRQRSASAQKSHEPRGHLSQSRKRTPASGIERVRRTGKLRHWRAQLMMQTCAWHNMMRLFQLFRRRWSRQHLAIWCETKRTHIVDAWWRMLVKEHQSHVILDYSYSDPNPMNPASKLRSSAFGRLLKKRSCKVCPNWLLNASRCFKCHMIAVNQWPSSSNIALEVSAMMMTVIAGREPPNTPSWKHQRSTHIKIHASIQLCEIFLQALIKFNHTGSTEKIPSLSFIIFLSLRSTTPSFTTSTVPIHPIILCFSILFIYRRLLPTFCLGDIVATALGRLPVVSSPVSSSDY